MPKLKKDIQGGSNMKLYDLSGPLVKGMWDYGKPYTPFETKTIADLEKNGYFATEMTITTHSGTHVEGDLHWWKDGESIDKIKLETFIGSARVLQLSSKGTPLSSISREDLIKAGGDNLKPGEICILHTGWDRNWFKKNYTSESPFLTLDAAQYLVDKKIKLLAADFAMCGDPRDGIDF